MSHYKPYPAYKGSGVEWLGQVPAHWQLRRLKHMARFSGGGTPSRDNPDFWNGDIPWVSPKDMKSEFITGAEECITAAGLSGSSSSVVPAERVLMVVRSGILKHTIPVAINDVSVALNQDMKAIWLDSDYLSARFFMRWVQGLNDDLLKVWLKQGATVESIEQDYLADTLMPVPPVSEREHIVQYLDRESARIDALIEKKTRFIELLREKRQALITHDVTKGLDPSLKMKDSGVEWMGEIPEHWAVCKLSFRYSVELGKMLDEKRITSTSLMPYLRNQDVQWDAVNTEVLPEMDIYPNELSRYTVRAGDLLVCEGGDVGRAAIWRGESDVIGYQKALHRLRPRNDETDTAEFFFFALMAAKVGGVFEESDSKATIAHLPAEKFRQYRFAFPPVREQLEITGHIRTHVQRLEKVQLKTECSIDLLKERRSALITAAVTGQIDLREAV